LRPHYCQKGQVTAGQSKNVLSLFYMLYENLGKAVRVLFIIILLVVILVYGKPFLVPLTFAVLLAMLMLPMVKWLEGKGWNKALAAVMALLAILLFFTALGFFIGWQVADLAADATKLQRQLSDRMDDLRHFIAQKLRIPPQRQDQIIEEQQSSSPGQMSGMITAFLKGLGSFLTDAILVLVYIFLFIYYRSHLKRFLVRLVPEPDEGKALKIVNNAQQVSQKYLTGLSQMIMTLWVMYGIGFSLIGVKNALFFAVLCGLLEVVPFVGNLAGNLITVGATLAQGGSFNMVLGIVAVYALVQFIQTYILEPLVVGAEVNINPLFTIIGLVAGEALWGIPGMILAIPLMGIAKIICDNIEALKPFGFLIGEEKKKKREGGSWVKKVKGWFAKG
jgi:predicted PurR-regulated permease PerM